MDNMLDRIKSKVALWKALAKTSHEDADLLPNSPLGPWFRERGDVYQRCADQMEAVINIIEKEMEEKDGNDVSGNSRTG